MLQKTETENANNELLNPIRGDSESVECDEEWLDSVCKKLKTIEIGRSIEWNDQITQVKK